MKIKDYWNYEEDNDDYTQGIIPIAKKAQKERTIKVKHKKDSRKIARENKMKRREEEL